MFRTAEATVAKAKWVKNLGLPSRVLPAAHAGVISWLLMMQICKNNGRIVWNTPRGHCFHKSHNAQSLCKHPDQGATEVSHCTWQSSEQGKLLSVETRMLICF